ncbi:FeoA family protein [Bacillus tianshenii]|nr:FeoA family protein [Bacillus tianshenii]
MPQVNEKPLSAYKEAEIVKIKQINVEGTLRRRLLDLGFVKGAVVEVLQKSPLKDPTAYYVSGTTIALRKEESDKIIVERFKEDEE